MVDGPREATTLASGFIARLDTVAERLRRQAAAATPPGLTVPDADTGERWEAGQVWAHLAELLPYWMSQVRMLLAAGPSRPLPFGRVKSDPDRIARIEAGRREPPRVLMSRIAAAIAEVRALLSDLPSEAWPTQGEHPTLGTMDFARIVEEFLVGHLEEHADQLEGLREQA